VREQRRGRTSGTKKARSLRPSLAHIDPWPSRDFALLRWAGFLLREAHRRWPALHSSSRRLSSYWRSHLVVANRHRARPAHLSTRIRGMANRQVRSLAGTRSARHPRFVLPLPTDAWWRGCPTQAHALTGRSIRTPLAVACSLLLRHRACIRRRRKARSIARAETRASRAAPSTRLSRVVAAASAARSVRSPRQRR